MALRKQNQAPAVVRLKITTQSSGGETAVRVRSPDVQGLAVVEHTREEALESAKKTARALRRSTGLTGPIDFHVE